MGFETIDLNSEKKVDTGEVPVAEELHTETLENPYSINNRIMEELSRGDESNIDELTDITPEIAKKLMRHHWSDGLSLNGLKTLSPEVAEIFAKYTDDIAFNGLEDLPDDTAEALSHYRGPALTLNGLKYITDSAAKLLSGYHVGMINFFSGSRLSLNGLIEISEETAQSFLNSKTGMFELRGLHNISEDVAIIFAKFKDRLDLSREVEKFVDGYRKN